MNLEAGITLFKQGKTLEARQIFLDCIRADQKNIPAWFWLVETISDVNEQIAALRLCLKANPGNQEVSKFISMLLTQQFQNNPSETHKQPVVSKLADAEKLPGQPEAIIAEKPMANTEIEKLQVSESKLFEDKKNAAIATGALADRVTEAKNDKKGQTKPSVPLPKKQKKRQSFFVFLAKVISILFLLGILFSMAFLVWWVSSGRTTRELVAAILPGVVAISTPESQVIETSIPSKLPTVILTETPMPTQTATKTPSPTLDPAFVMQVQIAISQGEENLALPVIAAQNEALSLFAFQNSSGKLEVINLITQQTGIEISLSSPIQALAFSSDGAFLVGIQKDGKVTVWNTVSWEERITFQLEVSDQELAVFQLDFVAGEDGYLLGYCLQSMGECVSAPRVAFFETSTDTQKYELLNVNRFSFGAKNDLLVWLQDNTPAQVRQVSVATGSTVLAFSLPRGLDMDGWNVSAFSADDALVAAATINGRVVIWERNTGRIISDWVSEIPNIQQSVFRPGLSQIVVGDAKSLAKVWDYDRNILIIDFNFYSDYARVFSTSSGRLIGIRSVTSTIEILDVNGLVSLQSFHGETSSVSNVFLYPQSELLVVVNKNGAITIWQSKIIR